MENSEPYQKSIASTKNRIRDLVNKVEPSKHFDQNLVQLNIGELSRNHKFVGLKPTLDEQMKMINTSYRDGPEAQNTFDEKLSTRLGNTDRRTSK